MKIKKLLITSIIITIIFPFLLETISYGLYENTQNVNNQNVQNINNVTENETKKDNTEKDSNTSLNTVESNTTTNKTEIQSENENNVTQTPQSVDEQIGGQETIQTPIVS